MNSWLTTNNPFDLQQYMIEDAYVKYLKKYVFDPFDEQFNRFYDILWTSDIFEGTQSRHWTDSFYSNLIYYSARFNIDMIFFSPDYIKKSLKEYTSQSPTLKSNLSRSVNLIVSKSDGIINDTDQEQIMKDLLTSEPKTYNIEYRKEGT